jgi:hypothetical protein
MVVPTDTELKKKELERLLQENKIELDQYLETVTKLEASSSTEKLDSARDQHVKNLQLIRTDYLLFISPLLILIGWFLAISGSVSGYESAVSSYETVGYPYSPVGLAIMMSAAILLSAGICCRWIKSISRGAIIVLEVLGWFLLIFAAYGLAGGFSIIFVQQTAYSGYSFPSISPTFWSFGLLLWFVGVLAITCGLAPLRKWFGRSIANS